MLEKLRSLVSEYLSISLGARLVIAGLVGAIGSSTVIGFLAEYGAVNYALAYGARLPTEGVPYLRYAATGISLAIFLIALGVLLILNVTLKSALQHFYQSINPDKEKSFAEMPLKQYIFRGVLPAIAATQIFMQFLYVSPLIQQRISQWFLIGFMLVLTVLIMVLGRKPHWSKWVVLGIFIACIGAFLVASFTPSFYGKALLFARQGGNLPVKLTINCKDISPCDTEISGLLFLRTTDFYFFRDPSTQQIKEIPSRSVEGVSYVGEERWGTR